MHSAGGGVGHRRHADRQALRRRGLRHRLARPSTSASASSASTTRSTTRSAGWERGLPKFDMILDAVGGKSFRRSYALLRAGRAAGRLRRLRGRLRRAANIVTALRTVVRMPRFNLVKQMSESKAVIGLNMLSLWKDRGTLRRGSRR